MLRLILYVKRELPLVALTLLLAVATLKQLTACGRRCLHWYADAHSIRE